MASRRVTGMSRVSVAETEVIPTHEEIAVRAFRLYLDRGAQDGRDREDWLQAERELTAELRVTQEYEGV